MDEKKLKRGKRLMAIFYLDTSALVKRYKTEEGSEMVDDLYDNLPSGNSLAISFLTVLEFVSAIGGFLTGGGTVSHQVSR